MLHVGIRELRNNVTTVVRRAAAGERVVVTIDGAPVAMLGPLEPAGAPTLADLVAAGLLRAARADRPDPPPPHALPVDVRGSRVLDHVRGG